MSPDPLGIHSPEEADLNLYAYVKGMVLKAIDPLGLAETYAEAEADFQKIETEFKETSAQLSEAANSWDQIAAERRAATEAGQLGQLGEGFEARLT